MTSIRQPPQPLLVETVSVLNIVIFIAIAAVVVEAFVRIIIASVFTINVVISSIFVVVAIVEVIPIVIVIKRKGKAATGHPY